jgi:hypothetical protein
LPAGDALAEFSVSKLSVGLAACVAVSFIGGGALGTIVFATRYDVIYSGATIRVVLGSVLPLLLGGFFALVVVKNWDKHLTVHADRIRIQYSRRCEDIYWTDIEGVFQRHASYSLCEICEYFGKPVRVNVHSCKIRLRDGSIRTFGTVWSLWARSAELVSIIDAQTCAALMDQYRERYRRGEPVLFGTIGVSKRGLLKRGALLPWEELSDYRFDAYGNLLVTQRRGGSLWGKIRGNVPWIKVDGHLIENVRLLKALLEEIRDEQA